MDDSEQRAIRDAEWQAESDRHVQRILDSLVLEASGYPPDTPPLVIPKVGEFYSVAIDTMGGYPMMGFRSVLTSMYAEERPAVYGDTDSDTIEFAFANGVCIWGRPLLLPDGYELDEETMADPAVLTIRRSPIGREA